VRARGSGGPNPWEVWWANLDPARGHDQRGRRPVIVVGSALACSLPNGLVIVIPTTTTPFPVPYRVEVSLDRDLTSFAMCEQVKSISVDRLESLHRCRTLPGPERLAVRFAVQQMLF
jgi:mRNA interferase MazF